ADPGNLYLVGACRDSGDYIAVTNNTAFLAQRWGLYAVDVSDPRNPGRVGSYSGVALGLAGRGDILCATFVTIGNPGELDFDVLDVSNPAAIHRIGRLPDAGGYDIHLVDSLAFLSGYYTGSGNEFQILSIRDSLHPGLVGDASTLGDNNGVWANTTARLAFVADRIEGLQVFDISTLGNPRLDTAMLAAGQAVDISVTGHIACVAEDVAGLRILDVSDPSCPTELSALDTVGQWELTASVVARDSFAYMPWTPQPTRLRAVSISDPRNPTVVAAVNGSIGSPADMVLRDSFLYTAGRYRFQVVSIARPREPELVGSCVTNDGVYFGLALQDTLAYVAGGPSLQIVNVANPANPQVVGNGGHPSTGVAVRDTFAYIPYPYDTLFVYSVANPASPRRLAAVPASVWPWDVALAESLLFVGTSQGVDMYGLDDPAQPRYVAHISTPYGVRRLHYAAPYVYAALWDAGVAVYETTATGVGERRAAAQAGPGRIRAVPNPAAGRVQLIGAAKAASVDVHDAVGRAVVVEATRTQGGDIELNVAGLEPGVYFVGVVENKKAEVLRIVRP
ncbi:MAG: T9SS type A sorting domain-containing protein, partial [candidate division WOR-3 bacterium]